MQICMKLYVCKLNIMGEEKNPKAASREPWGSKKAWNVETRNVS